jgi:hypothetical protein
MSRLPSLAEFIKRAQSEYGANLSDLEAPVVGPRGPVVFRYLEIPSDDVPLFAVLPDIPEKATLSPDVLRSLCRQLGIPPKDFDLDLG